MLTLWAEVLGFHRPESEAPRLAHLNQRQRSQQNLKG